MGAIDARLQDEALRPSQRQLHISRLLSDAFKWEGNILPPKELADFPGFTGDVLMAKALRWYESFYGEKLNLDWALGYVPAKIANTLWKVRIPFFYGQVRFFLDRDLNNRGTNVSKGKEGASLNVLTLVENLPPGMAERLPDPELERFWDFFVVAFHTLKWRNELKGGDLLAEAVHDYSSSTDDWLNGRLAQSRWASSQAVEKTLKGLLAIAGKTFPKKGAAGHDLAGLGKLVRDGLGIEVNERVLGLAMCSPAIRYREKSTTEDECLWANHSVLGVLEQLSKNPKVTKLLGKVPSITGS